MARVDPVERRVTVVFGPSRSKRFKKAVAEAHSGPGEYRELEPGRYEVRFLLGQKAAAYAGLARLLEHVRHWRATEVDLDPDVEVPDFLPEEWGGGLPPRPGAEEDDERR